MTKEEWIKIYTAKDGTWDKDYLIDKAYEIITCPIKTNYDRIKQMSIEEMSEFISHFTDGYHTPAQNKRRRKDMIKWLEQEANENDRT